MTSEWHPARSWEGVFAAIRAAAGPSAGGARGVTDEEIDSVERTLGMRLPSELAKAYRGDVPECLVAAFGEKLVTHLAPLDELCVWDPAKSLIEDRVPEIFQDESFLQIGRTTFGDALLVQMSGEAPGRVLVTDHDADSPMVVLGENLAAWLGRLMDCAGVEFAVLIGALDDVAPEMAERFARDHRRLNPSCEWAAWRLYQPGSPDEIAQWDEKSCQVRPIQEMPWLEHVTISDSTATSLAPLAGLENLHHLLLCDCQFRDLEPLRRLSKLEWLGIYSGPTTSLRSLAGLPALRQLRTRDTLLTEIDALAACPRFEFLEITDARFTDIGAVAQIRSLKKLAVQQTAITTIAPLAGLPKLDYLQLNGTPVRDFMPALKMPKLRDLCVSEGQIPTIQRGLLKLRRPKLEIHIW